MKTIIEILAMSIAKVPHLILGLYFLNVLAPLSSTRGPRLPFCFAIFEQPQMSYNPPSTSPV